MRTVAEPTDDTLTTSIRVVVSRRTLPVMARRARWWLISIGIGLAIGVLGVIVGVAIVMRVETGEWSVPDTDDVVRVVSGAPPKPAAIIFLDRAPVDLVPGVDDAAAGRSSVLASARNKPTRTTGWKGSNAGWTRLVACVRELFAPFAVEVVDVRPTGDNFVLVAVGGKPADIGIRDRRVGGLAPFNGEVIPHPVVFGFSAALGNDVRATCETIGMEVAHTYGLDHEYECKDVMTYLRGCGNKGFVDKDVACGEKKRRPCEGGAATQNSYRVLAKVLGLRAAR